MFLSNVRTKFFGSISKTPMNCSFSKTISCKESLFRIVQYNRRQLLLRCIHVATSRNVKRFQGNNRKCPLAFDPMALSKRHCATSACIHMPFRHKYRYHFINCITQIKTCWSSLSPFLTLNWIYTDNSVIHILVKFFASLELHHCKSLEISLLWTPLVIYKLSLNNLIHLFLNIRIGMMCNANWICSE